MRARDWRASRGRLALFVSVGALSLWLAAPLPAQAGDQFTLDAKATTFGPVVVDAAGNGYVTWNHEGSPETPTFCKLAPGARSCAHPIALSVPGKPEYASPNTPFAILGPENTVWVVASRYVLDDTLIWTSTNGGQTFGAPYEIPYIPNCPEVGPCNLSFSYANRTNTDDMLPITHSYAAYQGQVYKTEKGQFNVYWAESSNNPGLGFNIDNTGEITGGPEGATEFTFGNTGGGGVGGSALGLTSVGDVVEAYWLVRTPPALAYYHYQYNATTNPHPISPQIGWSGPTTIGAGFAPRMADGAAGLFLLSEDVLKGTEPTAVDVRKYNPASHAFEAPLTLAKNPATLPYTSTGGGLGENQETGELAALWPQFGEPGLMRLYLSSDGGSHFSSAQDVATVSGAYAGPDNARVAVAKNGTGFVTFLDGEGLHVADLQALGTPYKHLVVHHNSTLQLPVTCEAPKGACKASATVKVKGSMIASGHRSVPAGVTSILRLSLNASGRALLAAAHGHLKATLRLTITLPGAPDERLVVSAVIAR
jgi:hypothetical protein